MDLEAMAKLQPQIQALVGQITNDIKADPIPDAGADASPALVAAHEMAKQTGVVQLLVGQRFSQAAGLCEEARKQFLIASSQLVSAWNKAPTLRAPR